MAAARSRRTAGKTIAPDKGISRSYDDIEHRDVYGGEEPKPGLYPGKLIAVEQHTTSDDAVHWTYEITSGAYKGWKGHVYTNGTSTKWKEEQQLVACGLVEPGGSVALTFSEILKKAKPVRLRVVQEEYENEMRGRLKTVLPASEDVEPEDAEEEDPDFSESPVKPYRARSRRAKPEPEPEPEPEEEDDDEEDVDDEEGDEGIDLDALEEELAELSSKELQAKAKEFNIPIKERRGKSDEELIDMILDAAEEMNPSF